MNVLITGKNGQLGHELQKTQPENVKLLALGSNELDITDSESVRAQIESFKPDIVVNCAAYTAVDKAESDTELAYAVNAQGPGYLAEACREQQARLIHVSTDFVFNGDHSQPYGPEHPTEPLGIYGQTKLTGEQLVAEHLGLNAAIIRTSWVYSSHGNNFVKTMLRLMSEKPQLGVVCDQVGSPTYARNLARAIWALAQDWPQAQSDTGAAHYFHWSDLGVASWYDFAIAIQELALNKGLLSKAIPIAPITADQYPTPAKRPHFSVMDTSKLRIHSQVDSQHWREALDDMLAAL